MFHFTLFSFYSVRHITGIPFLNCLPSRRHLCLCHCIFENTTYHHTSTRDRYVVCIRFVSSPDRFVNFQGHLLTPSDRFVGLLVFVNFPDRFVRVVCNQLIISEIHSGTKYKKKFQNLHENH